MIMIKVIGFFNVFKRALAKKFVKKILRLRLLNNFKTYTSYFKNIFVGMHLKPGINIYLLANE